MFQDMIYVLLVPMISYKKLVNFRTYCSYKYAQCIEIFFTLRSEFFFSLNLVFVLQLVYEIDEIERIKGLFCPFAIVLISSLMIEK